MTRSRSARTGRMVSADEAKTKPNETVRERGDSALAKRVAIIENVLSEDGGRIGNAFRRASR